MSKLKSSYGLGTRRGLVPEDLLRFRWLDDLVLDPHGEKIAFTVKQSDTQSNGYIVKVFVHYLADERVVGLTNSQGQASSLAWSQDGGKLAYGWREGNDHSIRVWDGDSEKVYPIPDTPLTGLNWSADGTKLVGIRWTALQHLDDVGSRSGIPAPTMKVIRRLRYKQDGVGWVHDRFSQIFVLDLQTSDLLQITDSECDFSEPKWNQKGDKLAFIGMAREQNTSLGQGQIFIADYPNGKPRQLLTDWVGASRSPEWGEGDKFIAFAGHEHPAPTNRRIFMQPYLADVETGTAKALAPELDQEIGNYAVSDSRKGLSNITVRWPKDDSWIYFLLTEQGATHLYRINIEGKYERLIDGPTITFEYSPASGEKVAYGQSNPTNPGELYIWNKGKTKRLTALNPWLSDRWLSVPEEYWYDGLEGAQVQGWLMKPTEFDKTKKHPAIVYVHCSMFSWDFSHEFQCLVNSGYVITYFNQRGTTAGYGQAWTRASEGDQGGKDYEETLLGVNELTKLPYVDETRLGVTGGSCGGFMTNWIVGHTNRFKAAVTQRSIVNQVSFFGTSDIGPEGTERETGTNAWKDISSSWQQSPLAYAHQVDTPLLIVHSDEDYRCPLEQAEQLFAALRWMGKEVEMVVFEGESHGLSRSGRPGNRIERLRRIVGWFDKHL